MTCDPDCTTHDLQFNKVELNAAHRHIDRLYLTIKTLRTEIIRLDCAFRAATHLVDDLLPHVDTADEDDQPEDERTPTEIYAECPL